MLLLPICFRVDFRTSLMGIFFSAASAAASPMFCRKCSKSFGTPFPPDCCSKHKVKHPLKLAIRILAITGKQWKR